MKDLKSLPTLQDFAELSEEHRASLGLGPKEAEGEDVEARLTREDFLEVEETDAYAPVGEDEVIMELTESLSDLKQKNRELKKILPQPGAEKPSGDGAGSSGSEGTGQTSPEGSSG